MSAKASLKISDKILFLIIFIFGAAAFLLGVRGVLVSMDSESWVLTDYPAEVEPPLINNVPTYDVIVAGGDPEGIAAALSAGRNGLITLLICQEEALGGLMTLGMLNFLDMNYAEPSTLFSEQTLLTQGIFKEFFTVLGNAFDVEYAKSWFLHKINLEANITLKLDTKILSPLMSENGKEITGLKVLENGEEKNYHARRVIDATVDADVAAAAGVPYTIGTADYGGNSIMGVTLVFSLSGVKWEGVHAQIVYEKTQNNNYDVGIDKRSAWGYGTEAKLYVPKDPNIRLRGPNIGFQENGDVLLNAMLIFDIDPLDEDSYANALARGQAELEPLVEFMRKTFKGFENAVLVKTAEELYVRETRHIIGEYRLTIDDVLENRDQWDRIAHGNYPVDIQPVSVTSAGTVVGKPHIYSIPFRSLVPLAIDNLLVVGRSASYDSLPHGSARVIPIGMATGEAAGVACRWSIDKEESFRTMTENKEAITWVQDALISQGAFLIEYSYDMGGITEHWAYEEMKTMRRFGFASGGYNNNYYPERNSGIWSVFYALAKFSRELGLPEDVFDTYLIKTIAMPVQADHPFYNEASFSVNTIAVGSAYLLTGKLLDAKEAIKVLTDEGIVTELFLEKYRGWDVMPVNAEVWYLIAHAYEKALAESMLK